MTPVSRHSEPKILQKNKAKWLSILQKTLNEFARLSRDPQATEEQINQAKKKRDVAQDKYNQSEIKAILVTMFHGKCAYCESKVTVVSHGDIEHFYPKAIYPDKTFVWTNLLLSCSICNNKKDIKFPIDEQGHPLLIDPTDGVTNPADHLTFSWDGAALTASIYGRDVQGQTVVDLFDLNGAKGRTDLIKVRSCEVRKLMTLLKFAEQGDQEALALLTETCQVDAPYRAFALAYFKPIVERYALG